MLISLNEIKKLTTISISDDKLLELIGSRLVEIESVNDWSKKYKNIYVIKVIDCAPIEGTHLHLCKIDAGEELNSKFSNENYIQVVCGAPNVKKDMFAVWIAPGAIVPATFNTSEPFEISTRKLRGFESNGMLAGADELSLGTDHSGIVEIDPKTKNLFCGALFSDLFDLNDKIIEVENKSLTHRPDCFGLIGFAREVAGILGQQFKNIEIPKIDFKTKSQELDIQIESYELCPNYRALVYELNSLPKKSPYLTKNDVFLFKAGMHPISPIVDATNIIMLKTGQPLHAFDYDKFIKAGKTKTPKITVRLARENESLTLLDEKQINLTRNDIIIASSDTPVALAGAMGGKNTEIDENTKKIIVEIASFSLYNLRKTQMSHGIFSEAITRFTKGRPATDLDLATKQTEEYFENNLNGTEITKAENINPVLLENNTAYKRNVVKITTEDINSLLGSNYSEDLIKQTLENVNFSINQESNSEKLIISAPLWRSDIYIKEDIIEEVGRLLGYDNLPLCFPLRPFICSNVEEISELKSKTRNILSDNLGMNELLTYSFVAKKLQIKAGENPDNSYKIVNSISPKLECFRQSLIPSLLEKTYENEKAGYKNFSLYELNQTTKKSLGLNNENVPLVENHLGIVSFGDFYLMKQYLKTLFDLLKLTFIIKPIENGTDAFSPWLEPVRSANIYVQTQDSEILIGSFGELKQSIKTAFKLTTINSALEINLDLCLKAEKNQRTVIKLSKFPYVTRDLTFKVPQDTSFASVENEIARVMSSEKNLIYMLEPLSIYKKPLLDTKNISFRIKFSHELKTLTSEEISVIIGKIIKKLSATGAEIV